MTRGGKRENAGAPLNNKSALRTGTRTRDKTLRAMLAALPPDLRAAAIAREKTLYRGAAETPLIEAAPSNVTHIWEPSRAHASIPTPPPPNTQSNPYQDVIIRLSYYEFRNPTAFVRRHHAYVPAILDTLDYADTQEAHRMRNAPGLIRDDFHNAIGRATVRDGEPALACPACPWVQTTFHTEQEHTGT